MSSLFSNAKTFTIGGVHPPDQKLTAQAAIESIPLPDEVYIPLGQHIGSPAKPIIEKGQAVKVGDLLAESTGFISAPVHSSVSGTVSKIDTVIDASGYKRPAIIIKVEGDTWADQIIRTEEIKESIDLNSAEIIERIKDMGIVGLGGAAFPSYVKLKVPEGKKAEFLTVNAAECEPFLTSDHRLMLERSQEIIMGIKIVLKSLKIQQALIGIEDNKPDAIKLLTDLCQKEKDIAVVPLKTLYPQGGERQLVKALVNREIPPPPIGLPIDVGCVVFNVGTLVAIYEAVQKNKPLVERVVTVTGKSVKKPGNYLVRFGTPISHLIEAAGGLPEDTGKVLSGGPMMGKALENLSVPVTKGMSGIILMPSDEAKRKQVLNCIRCGKCVSLCPLGLEPYLLMTLAEKGYWGRAEIEKITNCCECGCCTFICPASRPLLDYIRLGKTRVLDIMRNRGKK